jgi:phosphoglycolate phosphatase
VTSAAMTGDSGLPSWIEADAYLFDIDGTLLNSGDGVHYTAFHQALEQVYGCHARINHVPVHGNTDVGILRAVTGGAGVPARMFETKLPLAVEHMQAWVRSHAADLRPQLCPSVFELLSRLQRRGKLLGIVSGNLESIGWMKLEAAGIRDFFRFGSFSGAREHRVEIFREGVEGARQLLGAGVRVCLVGDTPSDIAAAQQLGIPVLAVATGIYPHVELEALHPDLCVSCCTDLLSFLEGADASAPR